MVRYSLKNDIVNKTRIRDKTSYLPQCSYSENYNKKVGLNSQCGLFQPVVTDNGICFSFNPNSTLNLLKDSPFKNDFQEIYRYDMSKTNNVERARGAGDRFALTFMVDNSRYLRNKKKKRPFKILISSNEGYFNFVSSAKEVKAGYETIFDVQPIEIMASESLCEVEEKHRKCRLPKEVDKDSIFRSYSQISCEFECKIQMAREMCHCTPWNVPSPPTMENGFICDLFGNSCFQNEMTKLSVIETCAQKCPTDCNYARFDIIEREITPIDLDELCSSDDANGYGLAKEIFFKSGYYPFVSKFHKMDKMIIGNISNAQLFGKLGDKIKEECYEIMRNDIAIVKVRFASDKYTKTVMDKRFTFGDKLSSFGMKSFFLFNINIEKYI